MKATEIPLNPAKEQEFREWLDQKPLETLIAVAASKRDGLLVKFLDDTLASEEYPNKAELAQHHMQQARKYDHFLEILAFLMEQKPLTIVKLE